VRRWEREHLVSAVVVAAPVHHILERDLPGTHRKGEQPAEWQRMPWSARKAAIWERARSA
jgi:hypothetical protein